MLNLSNITFIVTDDCNFNCSYCFQKKEKQAITKEIIKTAADLFYPFLENRDERRPSVGFYGGEPLLAFDRVQYAVELFLQKEEQYLQDNDKNSNKTTKNIEFSITTNGSLLTPQMLDYFNRRGFFLMLSFDGLAQEEDRKAGTLETMTGIIKNIRQYPRIDFEINSVFSPRTINSFFQSMRYIIEQGGSGISFNFNTMEEWDPESITVLKSQLSELTQYLVELYKKENRVPVKNYHPRVPGARCGAGMKQMAVTPGGGIWGCFLFHDYFKNHAGNSQDEGDRDFSFGRLDGNREAFLSRYRKTVQHYEELRQDLFRVEEDYCFLCPEVETCMVCPVIAAYSSGKIGKISCRHCQLTKIQVSAREAFSFATKEADSNYKIQE